MNTKTAYFNYLVDGISLTSNDVAAMCHSGQCDSDVLACMKKPYIKRQLDKLPADKLISELSECGAWDENELKDHQSNLMRILWIAAGNIADN